jgi:hypothetical protein
MAIGDRESRANSGTSLVDAKLGFDPDPGRVAVRREIAARAAVVRTAEASY